MGVFVTTLWCCVVLLEVAVGGVRGEGSIFDGIEDYPAIVFTTDELTCGTAQAEVQHALSVGDREGLQANLQSATKLTAEAMDAKLVPAPHNGRTRRATLLCVTYTYVKANEKAAVLHENWGRACTRHVVVTNQGPVRGVAAEDVLELVPPGGESDGNLWRKTQTFMQHVAKTPSLADYDFYFVGGDDVMLYPHNLQAVLREHGASTANRAGAPLFIGLRFVPLYGGGTSPTDSKFIDSLGGYGLHTEFLSGAGYVLNKHTLHLMAQAFRRRQCDPDLASHAEDVYIANCLLTAGTALPREMADAQGESRFFPMVPWHAAGQAADPYWTWWYREFRPVPHPVHADIVSRHNTLWHYADSQFVRQRNGTAGRDGGTYH